MKNTRCSECKSKGIFHWKRPEDRNETDRVFVTNLRGDRNRFILTFVTVIKSFLFVYKQEYMKNW